jgi:hypothetical protein
MDSATRISAILAGVLMFVIYVVFDELGDPGRGQAAAISFLGVAMATGFSWDLRKRWWFWVTTAMIILLHIPLILLIPWPFKQLSYVALLPLGLLDFGIAYGIIRLVKNTIEKVHQ